MVEYPDMMVDTETTGLDPHNNGLLQIGAVKFNYKTGEIGPVFDRCMALAPNRFWDEETRLWWMGKNRTTLNELIMRQEDPATVLRDFSSYVLADPLESPIRMWAKPTHFDFPMIASHYRQFGMAVPVHFRFTRDLNSFIAALAGGAEHQNMPNVEEPTGAHNAVVDCVYQLKMLFAAKAGNFGPVEAEYVEFVECA